MAPNRVQQSRELDSIPLGPIEEGAAGRESQALPPVDGGRDAWLALASCFMLEALVWGFPFSYGIFQSYYLTHGPFSSQSPAGVAAISTTSTAIMYLSSPFVAVACQRYPGWRVPAGLAGLALMVAGLIVASFCNTVGGLLATQGVMYALGGLVLYFPAMYVIDEWFVARKGLAFGVVWTGTGIAGAIVPFLLQWLLDDYGFRTALRVWAIILLVLAVPSVLLMKNRLPVTGQRVVRPLDWSFLRSTPFWFYEAGNIIQSLAYFLPQLWLPSFVRAMGMPAFAGPLALCLLNIAACGGYLLQGQLVDQFHVTTAIGLATLASALSVFVFWGLATSQPMLYVFAILWGLSGGGFAANWVGCANAMQSSCNHVDTGLLISLMAAGKGLGTMIIGPLSEKLLQVTPWEGAGYAYGSQFGAIIVFTGVGAVFGGTACVGKLFKVV